MKRREARIEARIERRIDLVLSVSEKEVVRYIESNDKEEKKWKNNRK